MKTSILLSTALLLLGSMAQAQVILKCKGGERLFVIDRIQTNSVTLATYKSGQFLSARKASYVSAGSGLSYFLRLTNPKKQTLLLVGADSKSSSPLTGFARAEDGHRVSVACKFQN